MRSVVVGLVLALVFLTGCIEFEKQTLLIRADPVKDVVHLRLIYHGIYAGDSPAKDLEDLEEAAERGTRFFLFDNWPLEIDVGKPEKGEKDSPVNAVLRRYGATVTNGTFYLDEDGRLCAWQDVKFNNASKVLKTLGSLLNLTIMTGKADVLDDADADTKAMWTNAAMSGHEWFRIDPAGVHFEFPVSDADAARLKREFLLGVIKEARKGKPTHPGLAEPAEPAKEKEDGGEVEGEPIEEYVDETDADELTDLEVLMRVIARNKLSWIHRGNRVILSLAADENGVATGQVWNEGTYVPNLVEPEKAGAEPPKLPARIDREMTTRKLVETFPPK